MSSDEGVRIITARRLHPNVENLHNKNIRMGYRNLKSLNMTVKFDEAIKDMQTLKLDVLGISEVS